MKHSVLIVEDDRTVRESLARALSDTYKMYKAANGKEAMEIINLNSDIGVVVSDLEMPEVDGYELMEKIRNGNKNVNVIIITASYPVETAADAIRRGAFDYMTKPIDLIALEHSIEYAIASKKMQHTVAGKTM